MMTNRYNAFAICAVAAAVLATSGCGESVDRQAAATTPLEMRTKFYSVSSGIMQAYGAHPGCVLAAFGDAVPLAVGNSRVDQLSVISVAGAATMGNGRVVAVGHESFISGKAAGDSSESGARERRSANKPFVRECMKWLAKGEPLRTVYLDSVAQNLIDDFPAKACGAKAEWLDGYDKLAALPEGSVFVTFPDAHPLEDAAKLKAFVKRGGGVLCSVVGWGWLQITGGKSLSSENVFNAAMGECGLFASGLYGLYPTGGTWVGKYTDPSYRFPVGGEESLKLALLGASKRKNEDFFIDGSREVLLTELYGVLPKGDTRFIPHLDKLADASLLDPPPSPGNPLSFARLDEHLRMSLFIRRWKCDPEREWPAHPAAAVYPGLPSGPERVERTVEVDLSVPRWHGTGLFAAAGEPLSVEIPEGAADLGLSVRVGTSTCCISASKDWLRAPDTSVELPLRKAVTKFSSPFGGLVYIDVPYGLKGRGKVPVKIGKACPASWFVEGRDTPESWRKALAESPAPFAEIENEMIALTVPADVARKAGDPGEVLALWRQVMECDAKLAGFTPERWTPARSHERLSPERMCFDVQICAGYMHSGYPIMLPTKCMPLLLDPAAMREGKIDEVWGMFHEMGHNHQSPYWTFNFTEEVTVNFFSLYCMEKICGIKPRDTAKMGAGNKALREDVARWKAGGRSFDEWKSNYWLALDFFVDLQQRFGWEAFEKLFAEYAALPEVERPKTDFEKRRQFCERLSRIVGQDLSADFLFMLKDGK